jgi:endonuclease/exonuclease/phosphatase family metal-dependent hydrolase
MSWTNNLSIPGWYGSKGNADSTNYLAGTGSSTAGGVYSFGVSGVNNGSDRALGSIAASSTTYAYGVRFVNDTGLAQTNITVSYTGEQWRSGSTNTAQVLTFSYQVSNSPITNTYSASGWTSFSELSFISQNLTASSAALDGNATTNRVVFSNVGLTGVVVQPGQELFLRWQDVDDPGFDNGLAIDDLSVSFNTSLTSSPPVIATQPQAQSVTEGGVASFTVVAGGTAPLSYQWQFFGTNLVDATNDTLVLSSVTMNQAGPYSVTVTNAFGATNSQAATLTVVAAPPSVAGFSLLTYNTHGNSVSDWTTNSAQVQAIGRQVQYLNPDVITFQEIPLTNAGWTHMPEFVEAFCPGFYLATNSGHDGYIRSVILSRYPITRSKSWLDGADLKPFGYTNTSSVNADNFTRDLFEAQIAVPGFPQPLHVFTTHLKSGTSSSDDAAKRAAEASAVSNFFVTVFLSSNSFHPYTLTGDLNEDIAHPATGSKQPIQRLTNGTGLYLTTPLNPYSSGEQTFSIQGTLNRRYDYIMPNGLLFSNLASSQVFRTDLLPNPPPPLLAGDNVTASDHLPVLMVFNNPYDKPFRLTSVTRSNPGVTLQWQSVFGQPYRVEISSNLTAWSTLANNLTATGTSFTFNTNVTGDPGFFRVHRVP